MSIPHVFHHVWVSGDEMPESVRLARKTWIDRHPDWGSKIWRLEDLTWLRNRRLFESARPYSQKADFARYEILLRFGGVYLDTDMECLRPIDTLVDGYEFFSGREPGDNIAAGIIGAEPAHPIIREVVERLPASCLLHPSSRLDMTTGPRLLDRTIQDGHWEGRPGIRIFPPAFFYPYAYWEPWRRHEEFPRAFAVHHWGHSWKGQDGVTPHVKDVLPHARDGWLPLGRALWREMRFRGRMAARRRLLAAKRSVAGAARRAVPMPSTLRGLTWGDGQVLVAPPFDTRLLLPTHGSAVASELLFRGSHDDPFVGLLRDRLQRGMTFVDVGAGVGLFTILAGARVGRGGRAFAYEWHPSPLAFLRKNIEMNWFGDRVCVITKVPYRQDGSPDGSWERLDDSLSHLPYVDLLRVGVTQDRLPTVLEGMSGLLDQGKVGLMSVEYRADAAAAHRRGGWSEMDTFLSSVVQHRDATLHVPGDPRSIPLDEVLTTSHYPYLLIRYPGASIEL